MFVISFTVTLSINNNRYDLKKITIILLVKLNFQKTIVHLYGNRKKKKIQITVFTIKYNVFNTFFFNSNKRLGPLKFTLEKQNKNNDIDGMNWPGKLVVCVKFQKRMLERVRAQNRV